ncbi:methionyl-tRNA formyltransferase [Clostridiaceae bacterium M8S5]|nr:methionyl-tRNA formyltransferase [Clostridiaceae bacterium M8S5]
MRVVFMGTPDFAVSTLDRLHENGHDVVLVITQPDKKRGRGKKVSFPPVKERALELGIEVFQPSKINKEESVEKLREANLDVIVVTAFGQLVSQQILDLPKYGCINVHASLLPYYRGAAPINWAIINGEKESGVTTMMMARGLDSGDMLLKAKVNIGEEETAGELYDRLKELGANLLVETLNKLENGALLAEEQNHDIATYAPIMDKSLGHIDFSKSCKEIKNLVRGTQPWPGCYCEYKDNKIKIYKVDYETGQFNGEVGQILSANSDGIKVKCNDGIIAIKELQMPGKRRMNIKEFLAGNTVEIGSKLK